METQLPIEPSRLKAVQEQVSTAIQVPVRIAERSLPGVRKLALLSLVSAAWLGFLLLSHPDWANAARISIGLLLLPPPAFLIWLYFSLKDIVALPQRLEAVFQGGQQLAQNLRQGTAEMKAVRQHQGRDWRDLFTLGKSLRGLVGLTLEFHDLASLFGSALLLANPLIMALGALAMVATLVMALVALISGLIFVF